MLTLNTKAQLDALHTNMEMSCCSRCSWAAAAHPHFPMIFACGARLGNSGVFTGFQDSLVYLLNPVPAVLYRPPRGHRRAR